MLIPMTDITIYQTPSVEWPKRNKVYNLLFVTDGEINDSWNSLTNTARITFPQNLYFTDENKRTVTWTGQNMTADHNLEPLLLKGDRITIDLGFNYWTKGKQVIDVTPRFEGYVAGIVNKLPIEIECEDNMYLLKQISCPNKNYKGVTLQEILKDLLKGTDLTVNNIAKTSIGDFRTQDSETVAQVLNRLRKMGIFCGFRGNELQCSGLVYSPDPAIRVERIFDFQENVSEDDLQYQRTDDINIGIKAYSVSKFELTYTNSAGKKRKKTKRLSVFVTAKGITSEDGWQGEKRTLHLPDIQDQNDLVERAKAYLNRMYYEGLRGKLKTFGIYPLTYGNIATLRDEYIPERNGKYFIKSVTTEFGMGGLWQHVELDIRADLLSVKDLQSWV